MRFRFWCVAVALWGMASHAQAKGREAIFRLTPCNTAAVLILDDLAEHWDRLIPSPFARKWSETKLAKAIRTSPEFAQLAGVTLWLPFAVGATFDELRNDLFGDCVVFAYHATGAEQREWGALLVKPRKPETLRRVFDYLTKPNENRSVARRTWSGVEYFERREQNGQRDYLLRIDEVAAISDQEIAIHAIIDARRTETCLATAEWFSAALQSFSGPVFLTLVVNPRALDTSIQLHLSKVEANAHESMDDRNAARFGRLLFESWKRVGWLTLGVEVGDEIRLMLRAPGKVTACRTDKKSPMAEQVWARVDDKTLAALTIPIDFPSVAQSIASLEVEKESSVILNVVRQFFPGYNLASDVPNYLGPILGGILQTSKDKGLQAVAVLELRHRPTADGALPFSQTLENALRSFFIAILIEHNRKHNDQAEVGYRLIDGQRIHLLEKGARLGGFEQLAFWVSTNRLMVGSRPETLLAANKPTTPDSTTLALRSRSAKLPARTAPIAMLRPAPLLRQLAGHDGKPLDDKQTAILEAIALIEFVYVDGSWSDSHFEMDVTLAPTAAFRNRSTNGK